MKVFSLGADGLITAETAPLLGMPPCSGQARVLVCARGKNAAIDLLRAARMHPPVLSSKEFYQACSADVDALRRAGMFGGSRVLCLRFSKVGPVVWMDGEHPRVVGHLTLGDEPGTYLLERAAREEGPRG